MDDLLLYFVAVSRQLRDHKTVDQDADLGERYWDRTSDLFGVNADWPCVRVPGSVVMCR